MFFQFFFISVPNFLLVTTGSNPNYLSNTEILKLDNNVGQPPQYENHSMEIDGATGGLLGTQLITCGGYDGNDEISRCYKLGSSGTFATMNRERDYPASIVLTDKLWILGGQNNGGNRILFSTEYIFSDGRTENGPEMPTALTRHAAVKINQSTSLLAGGNEFIRDTYWFYNGNFTKGPSLLKRRRSLSLGIVRDSETLLEYVVATGGYDGNYLSDVEILNGTSWKAGKLLKLKQNITLF